MKHFGLIGKTLSHSKSAELFTKYVNNQDCSYELIETDLSDISSAFLKTYSGLNVTIPYKKDIIPYLDEVDEIALSIGSVNCIENKNGRLIGHNTDYIGITNTLNQYVSLRKNGMALILGNGGVSSTIQYYFKKNGITPIVVGRSGQYDITYNDLKDLSNYNFIVNATPVGMYPNVNDKPNIPYNTIKQNTVIFDLIYNPDPTLFLQECSKYTQYIHSGSKMLIDQALASYKYWKII